MDYVKQDSLIFFERHREAYPLYEAFINRLLQYFPQTKIKVQKSQISLANRYMYACVSFLRVKKKAEMPAVYFVLSLGMPFPLESDRVAVKTEPYPGRWTTHIIVSTPEDLNEELFGWIGQAYEFAENK